MSNESRTFKYPITCCSIGDVFQSNWNNLPADDFKKATNCAQTGNGIYQQVSLFISRSNHHLFFSFIGMLSENRGFDQ